MNLKVGEKYGGVRIDLLWVPGSAKRIFFATGAKRAQRLLLREYSIEDNDYAWASRFTRDWAKKLTKVTHSGLAVVSDISENERELVVVRDYVEGKSLADTLMDTHVWEPEQAVQVVVRLLQALGTLHGEDIAHGALHPRNVILQQDGTPILTDFGLESVVRDVVGAGGEVWPDALHYMTPEQLRGEEYHYSYDLYSVGVLLYHMLTGRYPYGGRNRKQLLAEISNSAIMPTAPSVANSNIPRSLSDIVMRAVSRTRHERIPTAPQFVKELLELRLDQPEQVAISIAETPLSIPTASQCAEEIMHKTRDLWLMFEGSRYAERVRRAPEAAFAIRFRELLDIHSQPLAASALQIEEELGHSEVVTQVCKFALNRAQSLVSAQDHKWTEQRTKQFDQLLALAAACRAEAAELQEARKAQAVSSNDGTAQKGGEVNPSWRDYIQAAEAVRGRAKKDAIIKEEDQAAFDHFINRAKATGAPQEVLDDYQKLRDWSLERPESIKSKQELPTEPEWRVTIVELLTRLREATSSGNPGKREIAAFREQLLRAKSGGAPKREIETCWGYIEELDKRRKKADLSASPPSDSNNETETKKARNTLFVTLVLGLLLVVVIVVIATTPPSYDRLLAAKNYEELLQRFPADPRTEKAIDLWTKELFVAGKYDEMFEKLPRIRLSDAEHSVLADHLLQSKQYERLFTQYPTLKQADDAREILARAMFEHAEFETVILKYPKTKSADQAREKLAQRLYDTGEYATVVAQYPSTDVAKKAKRQLQAAQGSGRLVLRSRESARVYLNQHYAGLTPLDTALAAGSYIVKFETEVASQEWTVTVFANREVVKVWDNAVASNRQEDTVAQTGVLRISGNPFAAQVFINGKDRGLTPFSAELPTGEYLVELWRDNRVKCNWTLTLSPGEIVRRSCETN